MSDDKIITFPPSKKDVHYKEDPSSERVLEVLSCDECENKTWIATPNGDLHCAVCKGIFEFKEYLDENV